MEENKSIHTIDQYIAQFSPEIQEKLNALRNVIQECAPEAKEKISWGMATFDYHGNLVHFAAFKKHIGFYPSPSGVEVFKDKLTGYITSKGAIQFPMEEPIPFELIKEIVRYRVQENFDLAEAKKTAKKKPVEIIRNKNLK
ncbi:MAG: DUF1801 domain-containing protein [Mobilitalea sp.]